MESIQIHSEVGTDGTLSLQVPLGAACARMPVVVTISPIASHVMVERPVQVRDWHAFIAETYGSCSELGVEEPNDLPLQSRLFGE